MQTIDSPLVISITYSFSLGEFQQGCDHWYELMSLLITRVNELHIMNKHINTTLVEY